MRHEINADAKKILKEAITKWCGFFNFTYRLEIGEPTLLKKLCEEHKLI